MIDHNANDISCSIGSLIIAEGVIGYGGIIAFVSNSIACKHRMDLESYDKEGMYLEVRVVNDKFFFLVLHRTESNTDGNY